jgi:hypothetical protein
MAVAATPPEPAVPLGSGDSRSIRYPLYLRRCADVTVATEEVSGPGRRATIWVQIQPEVSGVLPGRICHVIICQLSGHQASAVHLNLRSGEGSRDDARRPSPLLAPA